MGILQKTSPKRIEGAVNMADKAIGVFTSTLESLKKANDTLHDVIATETQEIKDHELHISQAKVNIQTNNHIISKLREFSTK